MAWLAQLVLVLVLVLVGVGAGVGVGLGVRVGVGVGVDQNFQLHNPRRGASEITQVNVQYEC